MAANWVAQLKWPENEQRPRRLERVEETYWVRGMYFTCCLDFIRENTTALDDVLHELGFAENPSYGYLSKCSERDYIRLQTACAKHLVRLLGTTEETIAGIAANAVEAFFRSVGGKTMKLLAGKEPHRLLGAGANAFSLAIGDKAKRTYTKTSDHSGLFTFANDVLGPCHNIGVLTAALHETSGLSPTFDLHQTDLLDFKLNIQW